MNIINFPTTSQDSKTNNKSFNGKSVVSESSRFSNQSAFVPKNGMFKLALLSHIKGLLDQLQDDSSEGVNLSLVGK